jgi:hypothetical protein
MSLFQPIQFNGTVPVPSPTVCLLDSTSSRYTHFAGSRLVRCDEGEVYVIEKSPAEIAGERLLRPLIDAVSHCFHRAYSLLTSVDRAFSFPAVSAAPIPKLEQIREAMGALGNVALSEDMIQRVIEDKTGTDIEPGVVKAVKKIIDLVGTVLNPSDFTNNLLMGELEAEAKKKIGLIAQLKKNYEEKVLKDLQKIRNRREINNQLSRARAEMQALHNQIDVVADQALKQKEKLNTIEASFNQKNTEQIALAKKYKDKFVAKGSFIAEMAPSIAEIEAVLQEGVPPAQYALLMNSIARYKGLLREYDDEIADLGRLEKAAMNSKQRLQSEYTENENALGLLLNQQTALISQIEKNNQIIADLQIKLQRDEL